MNKKLVFSLVILFGLLLMSCDPDDDINGGNGSEAQKDYWERSAWTHLQLKGKVKLEKTTYEDSDSYYETHFGEQGQIIKTVNRYDQESPRVNNFEYNSSGQLVKDNYGTYEYGNHGKYIPRETFHINMAGLVKNLTKFNDRIEFEFDGDNLLVTWDGSDEATVVKYTGNYPTQINDINEPGVYWSEYMKASYQANGMWDVFEEGFFSTGENPYVDSRKTYYKKDNEFMLIDKMVREYTSNVSEHYSLIETRYIYNDKKDVIRVEEYSNGVLDEEGIEHYEYEYDAKGNWTKKTFKYPRNDYTNITYRQIEYFD